MDRAGRLVSSANISINFRTTDNDVSKINSLKNIQLRNKNRINNEQNIIETKIYDENGAPFVKLKTNLCSRPLKFLLDTGAAISLIASDILSMEHNKINYKVNIFGIIGTD